MSITLQIEHHSIFQITKLTDDPIGQLENKIENAVEMIEEIQNSTLNRTLISEHLSNHIDDMIQNIRIAEALSFVDNLLINYDFYEYIFEDIETFKANIV